MSSCAWGIQSTLQWVLEEELTALQGRQKSQRRPDVERTQGYRESTESWRTQFADVKARGPDSPKLLVADGAAGVWRRLARCGRKRAGNAVGITVS